MAKNTLLIYPHPSDEVAVQSMIFGVLLTCSDTDVERAMRGAVLSHHYYFCMCTWRGRCIQCGCIVACRKKISIWLAVQGSIVAFSLVQFLGIFCKLHILQ